MARKCKHVLGMVVTTMAAAVFGAFLGAQSQPDTEPRFEAVTIKPSDPASPTPGGTGYSSNRFHTIASVEELLKTSYGVQDFQISGAPPWLSSDNFDIDARLKQPATPDQLKLMIKALLADRFKLVLHRETRVLPVYVLAQGGNGPKLAAVKDGDLSMRSGSGWISGKMSISDLANHLAPAVGRTVRDITGMNGTFEINLKWAPDGGRSASSIFTAVEQQLGLRLESAKGPMEMLVIDRVAKPSGE